MNAESQSEPTDDTNSVGPIAMKNLALGIYNDMKFARESLSNRVRILLSNLHQTQHHIDLTLQRTDYKTMIELGLEYERMIGQLDDAVHETWEELGDLEEESLIEPEDATAILVQFPPRALNRRMKGWKQNAGKAATTAAPFAEATLNPVPAAKVAYSEESLKRVALTYLKMVDEISFELPRDAMRLLGELLVRKMDVHREVNQQDYGASIRKMHNWLRVLSALDLVVNDIYPIVTEFADEADVTDAQLEQILKDFPAEPPSECEVVAAA